MTSAALDRSMRQLKEVTSARDAALMELADARAGREQALRELAEEREEREATNLLLQDFFEELRALKARNALLENSLAQVLLEREEGRASAAASAEEAAPGLNMANVRQAIEA